MGPRSQEKVSPAYPGGPQAGHCLLPICPGQAPLPRAGKLRGSGPTHSPLVGVPGKEPSCEGGGFVALLDQHDGGGRAPPCWVCLQVLLAPGHSLLLLTGSFPKPQEDLGQRGGLTTGRWRGFPELTTSFPPLSIRWSRSPQHTPQAARSTQQAGCWISTPINTPGHRHARRHSIPKYLLCACCGPDTGPGTGQGTGHSVEREIPALVGLSFYGKQKNKYGM